MVNPALTGVSAERHWLVVIFRPPPPPIISETESRSEAGEAACKSPRRIDATNAKVQSMLIILDEGLRSGQMTTKNMFSQFMP